MLIVEGGSGGDLVMQGADLAAVYGYEGQPYLAMFGGVPSDKPCWMNSLLLSGGIDNEFISQTEAALNNNALNSDGRIKDIAAINNDLKYLINDVPGTKISVNATITSDNRLDVTINFNGQLIYMNWNPNTLFLTYKI